MIKDSYFIIGVMSGTSLDGLDLCYVKFEIKNDWKFDIIQAETISYSEKWKESLINSIHLDKSRLHELDMEYTTYLADQINHFITKNQLTQLDAICSHGHTVLHQPNNQLTYQIGNLATLASRIGKTVICDFRVQDVKLGGQGAPLVPIGDKLLFHDYDICLNLGGFANLSYDINDQRVAFDICPVNIVLNHFANKIGFNYDDKGGLSKSGTINDDLLTALNDLRFYEKLPPKSLGLEWVKTTIFPLINSFELSSNDILRTFTEHIAIQISKVLNQNPQASVLVTGGGAYNTFLMERLIGLTNLSIILPSHEIIDFKEALIFGFLGVLKLRNENNCLQSVTGAVHDHSFGKIFNP